MQKLFLLCSFFLCANFAIAQCDSIGVTLPTLDAGEDITLFCSIPNYFSLSGSTNGTDVSFPIWTTPNGEITFGANTFEPLIDEPGTYILTLLDNISGCFLRDTMEVFLEPALIDSITTTDADCDQTNGMSTVFSQADSSDLIVNWSNGATGATVTDLAAGSYNLTVTDGNCVQEAFIFVEESEVCEVTIRGRVFEGTICHPDSAQIDWFSGFLTVRLEPIGLEIFEPLSDGSYEFIVPPGDYTLVVDDGPYLPNNTFVVLCPADNNIAISLPEAGSVSNDNNFYWVNTVNIQDENLNNIPIEITPNPVTNLLTLNADFKKPIQQLSVEIYDASGQLVFIKNRQQHSGVLNFQTNTSTYVNGLYFIKIQADGQFSTLKFLKE